MIRHSYKTIIKQTNNYRHLTDIPEEIKSFLLLFADDLKLVINADFPQIVQNDLDILSQWQKKWLIDFNTADNKCKVLEVMNKGRKVSNTYIKWFCLLPTVKKILVLML